MGRCDVKNVLYPGKARSTGGHDVAQKTFRPLEVLVRIIWFYYAFPIRTGIEVNPFLATVLGILLNTMAFWAAIYCSGIQFIDSGQWEAGKVIGI